MLKKIAIILLIIFLCPVKVSAFESTTIEIFDINKGYVIKKVDSTPVIQNQVNNCLKGITGIYSKFNPIPNKGYMIKIPFDTPIALQNQWVNAFIDEVIIIFPEQEERYIMVFDNRDKTLFFGFEGDVDGLLKNLNFYPKKN